ncbi:MAG: hypothetical protein V8S14_03490 [Lachnospiraceae bacterium]
MGKQQNSSRKQGAGTSCHTEENRGRNRFLKTTMTSQHVPEKGEIIIFKNKDEIGLGKNEWQFSFTLHGNALVTNQPKESFDKRRSQVSVAENQYHQLRLLGNSVREEQTDPYSTGCHR